MSGIGLRLNDLLISGKSGTMLSITACSSTGQFCQEGSCGCSARDRLPRAPVYRDQHLAAPAFHPADAEPAAVHCLSSADRIRVIGSADQDLALQTQRFEIFFEAHDDARCDIAVAMGAIAHPACHRVCRETARARPKPVRWRAQPDR